MKIKFNPVCKRAIIDRRQSWKSEGESEFIDDKRRKKNKNKKLFLLLFRVFLYLLIVPFDLDGTYPSGFVLYFVV